MDYCCTLYMQSSLLQLYKLSLIRPHALSNYKQDTQMHKLHFSKDKKKLWPLTGYSCTALWSLLEWLGSVISQFQWLCFVIHSCALFCSSPHIPEAFVALRPERSLPFSGKAKQWQKLIKCLWIFFLLIYC